MNSKKNLAVATAVAALCLTLAACGVSLDAANAPRSIVPASRPIFADLRTDISKTTADEALRRQYLAAGMKVVEAAIDRGGRLSISVFFSHGLSHSILLLDTPVPTPAEIGGVARAQKVIPIRSAAASVLDEALGLARRRPEVAEALTGISGEGTDIAGSLASGLIAARGQPNPILILVTDGADVAFTGHYGSSPRSLAARVTPELPKTGAGVTVALVGIGGSTGGMSTRMTERLLGAWRLACKHIGSRCYVSPNLDLSRLFG